MKTKASYLVVPCALMAAFVGYFVPANARFEAVLEERRQAAAEQAANAATERAESDRRALAEQQQRIREREAAAADRAAQKQQEQDLRDEALRASLAAAEAERAGLRAEIAALDGQLADVVQQREQGDAAVFAAWREQEALRIERRSLDLELQRSTEVLAESVAPGIVTAAPIFPSPYPGRSTATGS